MFCKVTQCRQLKWFAVPKPPWMWNLATAPAWSDLIHVTLWRNYEFLHSFGNFSKSNAIGENFIRTKFILHKIFLQMSILSSRKTLWMFFNLCWKNCENHLWEDMTILRGSGRLTTKINVNFFVRIEFLNIFHITIFSEKETIFCKINMKNNFSGAWHFSGNGLSNDKNEYNLFYGKWGNKYGFEIFSSKTHCQLKAKKPVLGAYFPPYQLFYWTDCFQKKYGWPMRELAPTMWISWKSAWKLRPVSWQ